MKKQDLESVKKQINSILGDEAEFSIEKFETNDNEFWFTIKTDYYRVYLEELLAISKILHDKNLLVTSWNDKIKIISIISTNIIEIP